MVYFGSEDNHLYALDVKTGEEKWKFETGDSIESSPIISEGVVYFGSNDNHLYALDAKTGEEKWKFKTGDSIKSSPIISEGVVYFGSNDNHLYALDAKTGEEKWKFGTGYSPLEAALCISPTISEGVVYFGSYGLADYLYALDVKTGKEKWKFKTGGIYSSSIISEGVAYFGSGDNHLYALDIQIAEKSAPEMEKELQRKKEEKERRKALERERREQQRERERMALNKETLQNGIYTILADQKYCTEYVGDYMTVEEMAKALVESDGVDLPGNWHEYNGLYHCYGIYELKDEILTPDGTKRSLNLELKTDITDCGGDFVISGTGDESGTVGDFFIELDHGFNSTKLRAIEEYGLVRGYEYDGIGFEGSPEGNPIEGDKYRFYGQSTTIQVKTSNGYEEFDLKKTISDMKGKGIDVSDSEAVLKYLKEKYNL